MIRVVDESKSVVFSESKKTVELMRIARETVVGALRTIDPALWAGADSLRIGEYVRL